MNRPVPILCALVACELAAAAMFFGWLAASPQPAPGPPLPDLSHLDSVTVQEIRQRQERVSEDTAETWKNLAEIYVLYGFFVEADLCCSRSAELDPESFWTYLWWGTALSRLGETTESTEKFRAGIPHAEGPLADVCRYCIGLNLLREENPSAAETAFRAAKGYAPADYELAKILVRSDRAQQAVPILDGLIEGHSQTQKYYQLRARAADLLGDAKAAADFREQTDRAVEVLPSDELTGFLEEQIGKHGLDVWIQEGRDLLASGRADEAAGRLREVLAAEWRQTAADLLVQAELATGHPDAAIEILNEAIARYSPQAHRLVLLGNAYQMQGDLKQAVHYWERATRVRVDQAAHEKLSEHYKKIGDGPQAARHRALALHAQALKAARKNDLKSAQTALEQAVELAPQQAHSWYHLGKCRRHLGEATAAEEAYRQSLQVDPNHGRARRALDRLLATP